MERVIDLLHERDQRPDVAIAQARARIVPLQLFDQPARIINADVKLIVRAPQKGPGQLAQFPRGRAGQPRELRAAFLVDQAIFEVDPDLRVGPLKEPLDLAEERFVHDRSEDAKPAAVIVEIQQLESESRFSASRTSRKRSAKLFVNVAQVAPARGRVRGDELIVRPADLLVKGQVGRAAETAALRVLVENAAEKERVIADMRAEQERLFRPSRA